MSRENQRAANDFLVLSLVVPQGETVRKEFPNIQRSEVEKAIRALHLQVSNKPDQYSSPDSYLAPAQKLYQLLLTEEIKEGLKKAIDDRGEGIDNLVFVVDSHLPPLPVAALHDSKKFLIEHYSLGLMPGLNLTDTNYTDVRDTQVLIMGASDFSSFENANPLPAVEVELEIVKNLWPASKPFLNQNFTLEELSGRRKTFGIVHLATHGQFFPDRPEESFLLFGNEQVSFAQIRQTRAIAPPMELLVLSACDTASGSAGAELGFAGLAYQLGAKTVLASLGKAGDASALNVITLFYRYLQDRGTKTKAEALQKAQLAILLGQIVREDGQLRIYDDTNKQVPLSNMEAAISLIEDWQKQSGYQVIPADGMTHPYYWANFTLVGSPW